MYFGVVSGSLFFNHFIVLLTVTSQQIIVQITVIYWRRNARLTDGQKKVKRQQNGKGEYKKVKKSIERKQFSPSWEKFWKTPMMPFRKT